MPLGEIPKLEITKPPQVRHYDRPKANLFTELQSYPGSSDYRTPGGSDGHSGDRRIMNTGDRRIVPTDDLYPLMSGSRSDIPHLSSNQESLTPDNHLDELRLRIVEVQSQQQVNREILASVEKTLTTTAKKVDELKNWQINATENVTTSLESHLEMLNNMKNYINNAKERLLAVKSLTTQDYKKLRLEIKNAGNRAANGIFSEALSHISLYDLEINQEKDALQAKTETYRGKIESFINMTDDILQDVKKYHSKIITEQNRLKENNNTLVNIEQTLTETANKIAGLKNWKLDPAENTTIDLAGHLEMLNNMEKDIIDANDKLPTIDLNTQVYDELFSEIEKTKNQYVKSLFMQILDKLCANNSNNCEKNTILKMQSMGMLKEIDAARAEAESNLPPTLREIKNYYRHLFDQARVGSREASSDQTIVGSGGVHNSFEVANLELAKEQENLNKYKENVEAVKTNSKRLLLA